MKPTKEDQKEAMEFLRRHLKPGDTVYTILRHVSRSGMMRRISPVIVVGAHPVDVDYQVAKLGIWKRRYPLDGLFVEGCGMDQGFSLVYELSRVLFPDGFGEKCLVCGNRKLAPEEKPHPGNHTCRYSGRNGDTSGWDTDGGYALNQRWL